MHNGTCSRGCDANCNAASIITSRRRSSSRALMTTFNHPSSARWLSRRMLCDERAHRCAGLPAEADPVVAAQGLSVVVGPGRGSRQRRLLREPVTGGHGARRGAASRWLGQGAHVGRARSRVFLKHYRRADGLYRTLVAPDGSPIDNSALLYDQAFALLGIASARRLLGPDPALDEAGTELVEALYSQLKRVG